ncbi:MAG TPA: N-acetylneuraminate synthase [Firmicutes bacterium]|jgi:N,N'-diacetyllegionaminate synthase|nr:N-acetylneuraminate synthase [Bacillota bacterium]
MNLESKNFDFNCADRTIIIAEIGVNHNGDAEIARKLVNAAVDAGVDAVKFQAFRAEKEISQRAFKAPYQEKSTAIGANQLEMCKALELSAPVLLEMKNYCTSVKMSFLCTAFDFDSVDLLVDELKVETIKIPSGEITNFPLLTYIGNKKKAVILSTGASNLAEVGMAIEALQKSGCPELLIFHCVSSYPAPCDCINLRAMKTLRTGFGLPVGFSDHTTGIYTAIAAAALGAVAVEKHLTLDRKMVGPDHQASIEPNEMAELVKGIRIANSALGSPLKEPSQCEIANLPFIRKSLVAASDLQQGTILSREMIEIKRPLAGIEPGDFTKIIGRTLKNGIQADNAITWEDLA